MHEDMSCGFIARYVYYIMYRTLATSEHQNYNIYNKKNHKILTVFAYGTQLKDGDPLIAKCVSLMP